MEKKLFADSRLSQQEIIDNLEALSIGSEELEYMKPLTDEEVQSYNERIVETNLKIRTKEADKKSYMEKFKLEMDPLKENLNSNLDIVKTKLIEKTGVLFMIPDDSSNTIGYYDEEGVLIKKRPMLREERKNVVQFNKAM